MILHGSRDDLDESGQLLFSCRVDIVGLENISCKLTKDNEWLAKRGYVAPFRAPKQVRLE